MDLTTKQITMDAREFIKEQGFGDINSKDRPINIEIANVAYLMELYASQQMPSEEEREKLIIFLEWYLDNGITVYDESDESKEAVDEYLKSLQPKQKEQLKNCIGTDYGGFKGEREVKEV